MSDVKCPCGWKGPDDDLVIGKIETESRYVYCCPRCGRIYYDNKFLELKGLDATTPRSQE